MGRRKGGRHAGGMHRPLRAGGVRTGPGTHRGRRGGATGSLRAQAPPPPGTTRAIDAVIGNQVLQLRYLTDTPLAGVRSNLDYGVLLSEDREFIGSAAWMFDTDLKVLPRLTFQIGPQGYLSRLAAQEKTDVFAVALGANVRYDLIPRIGLAA